MNMRTNLYLDPGLELVRIYEQHYLPLVNHYEQLADEFLAEEEAFEDVIGSRTFNWLDEPLESEARHWERMIDAHYIWVEQRQKLLASCALEIERRKQYLKKLLCELGEQNGGDPEEQC